MNIHHEGTKNTKAHEESLSYKRFFFVRLRALRVFVVKVGL